MTKSMLKNFAEAAAPGRLDVMGGIADYSGSLVLQMPISQKTCVTVTLRSDYQCTLESKIGADKTLTICVDYRDFLKNNVVDYDFAKAKFKQLKADGWIGYVLGCALALQKEKEIEFKGADFNITSEVPLGKGVSSSASIEVATIKALSEAFDVSFLGTELPKLAQRVENLIVGAPCGLMDQLASYLGEPKKLLPIICQPDLVEKPISIPKGIFFIGIDSGVRHSVSGASYSDVRCAAFMGYTIIARSFGVSTEEILSAKLQHAFSKLPYTGYLCNISVNEFENSFLKQLPTFITGKDFINNFLHSIDSVTTINPETEYAIRECVAHPINENERVHTFKALLLSLNESVKAAERNSIMKKMGELMYQSHASYSQCGLGSDRTDEIVELSKNQPGIYGAKITGGGNGGTVCLLTDEEGIASAKKIHQMLCEKYKQELVLFE